MTDKSKSISRKDLHAYVDGALDLQKHRDVEQFLTENPQIADEVSAWTRQNESLKALYGGTIEEAPPARLDPHEIERKTRSAGGWSSGWKSIAASLALICVGGGMGWLAHDQIVPPQVRIVERPMVQRALRAHRVYAAEVLHPVEVGVDQEAHLVSWLSKRLKHKLKAPDLKESGFSLIGGRLLPDEKGVAAQFMYENPGGRRLTLYLNRGFNQQPTSFQYTRIDDMNTFYWMDDNVSYALVSGIPRARLSLMAHDIYRQLDN